MLTEAALGLINHILESECWARNRLKPFAGQVVRLKLGLQRFSLCITATGHLRPASLQSQAHVTLSLPADSVVQALASPSSLRAKAQVSGSAQLAECLLTVFSNLRWDIEGDLAPYFGDIGARRLILASRGFIDAHRKLALNLFRNVAEYLSEESPALPRRHEFSQFSREATQCQEHLQSLCDRVVDLES
jgi:ubiquinone biosynthesis protein UbiJ